jgi:3',5'-cyclic AMP phosphodiesterase CpdA
MTRIYHISDVHFGAEDGVALRWFEEAVASDPPDAIILTGDLTFRARTREFSAASDWIRKLHLPVVIGPGNHDLPYFNPIARMAAPYARFNAIQSQFARPLVLDGVSIVPLDTTAHFQWRVNWAAGRVRNSRLQRAVSEVTAVGNGDVVLVACHHPLIEIDPAEHVGTRRGAAALKALALAGADAFISGHVHNPFDVKREVAGRCIRLIGAGTLSERIRGTPPSFNDIRIEAGTLSNVARKLV